MKKFDRSTQEILEFAIYLMKNEYDNLSVMEKKHTDSVAALSLLVIAREIKRFNDGTEKTETPLATLDVMEHNQANEGVE